MIDNDPIRRGKVWATFYEQEGGLRDMLSSIRAAYFQRMSTVQPWEVAKLANLAIGARIAEDFDMMIKEIMGNGLIVEHAQAHADKIAAIPDFKRRFI